MVRWSVGQPPTVPSTIFVSVAHDSISAATTSKMVVGEPPLHSPRPASH